MNKRLLSLPPNLVDYFHTIEQVDRSQWYCTSDPINARVGSGGGTIWLLESCWQNEAPEVSFESWLSSEYRILLHAGGQSRRLPGYAPSGKILTPIPVFRWERGQKLNQNIMSLQLPLYDAIMQKAPSSLRTLIASGDVYIRTDKPLQSIPEVDVVCYGLWVDSSLAKNHGIFVMNRNAPEQLDYMLQKPSLEEMSSLMQTHLFLMDIGIWILSDKAVQLLRKRSKHGGKITYYDLYSQFGLALGANPKIEDEELNQLSVAILPLHGGQFYHYGTSRELISSTLAIQNSINDQRIIMHHKVKPHPAMFIQNAQVEQQLEAENAELWIENSWIGKDWTLSHQHVITGVPENNWNLTLLPGICIDIVPVGETNWVARPYGFNDLFKGEVNHSGTYYMGQDLHKWMVERNLELPTEAIDIQNYPIFPSCSTIDELEVILRWMISEPHLVLGKQLWRNAQRYSAEDLSAHANLMRLTHQRDIMRAYNWTLLASNHEKSVFYQLNLDDAACNFERYGLFLPTELSADVPLLTRVHDQMFRARVMQLRKKNFQPYEDKAFGLLREGLIKGIEHKPQMPLLNVYEDQIVWARSPVRIDLAGGWSDTPPYCLCDGGNVVNMAIELNGQPPLQVYVKPSKDFVIILRSIDLGAIEIITSFEELMQYNQVGSPFSIPKAALCLAGFSSSFGATAYTTLNDQLKVFGSGIEITLLSAIPVGSGLGTSSILASTVLGALSDFCGLNWDKNEICRRTLVLEQLLTTGGGWQDQYGGVLHGIKLIQTQRGFDQTPTVHWLPDHLFTQTEYEMCHLLYYTGITRTAKSILAEIVRGMFLNSTEHLKLLREMKQHALELFETIQCGDFINYGKLVGHSWEQNKLLDIGTNPSEVEAIISRISDYCLGYKLPGAGGGGYLYMVAKDPEAAACIQNELKMSPPNTKARFVDMNLSKKGLQISRS